MNRYRNNTKINTPETFNFMHNLAGISLGNILKMSKLQLKISNDTLQQISKAVRTFTSATSPQKLLEQTNEIAQEGVKTNSNNYQHLFAIVNDTKSQCLRAFAAHLESCRKSSIYNSWSPQPHNREDYHTSNVVDSLTKLASTLVNESGKSANKSTKAANEKSGTVNTHVKNAAHSAPKANKDKKEPAKKAESIPQKDSSPKPAVDNGKAAEKSKEPLADKTVNEAKEAI